MTDNRDSAKAEALRLTAAEGFGAACRFIEGGRRSHRRRLGLQDFSQALLSSEQGRATHDRAGWRGIELALDHAARAASDDAKTAAMLVEIAKMMAFNVGANTWPGWGDDGIDISPVQRERGHRSGDAFAPPGDRVETRAAEDGQRALAGRGGITSRQVVPRPHWLRWTKPRGPSRRRLTRHPKSCARLSRAGTEALPGEPDRRAVRAGSCTTVPWARHEQGGHSLPTSDYCRRPDSLRRSRMTSAHAAYPPPMQVFMKSRRCGPTTF